MGTGMPELPKGYFWRVRVVEGYVLPERISVDIRRKRLIGSEYVVGLFLQHKNLPDPKQVRSWKDAYAPLTDENVLHTAQLVLEQWERKKAKAATEKRLLGDYPPNKLELGGNIGKEGSQV